MKTAVPLLRGSNSSLHRARAFAKSAHVPGRTFRLLRAAVANIGLDFEPLATLYGGLQ